VVDEHAVADPGAQPGQRARAVALDERDVVLAARRHLPVEVRRRRRQLVAVGQAAQRGPHRVEVVALDHGGRGDRGPGLGKRHQAAIIERLGVAVGIADGALE
jgi:hypothetical protein